MSFATRNPICVGLSASDPFTREPLGQERQHGNHTRGTGSDFRLFIKVRLDPVTVGLDLAISIPLQILKAKP